MGAGKSGGVKSANQPSTSPGNALERRCATIQKVRNVLLICLDENTDEQEKEWPKAVTELQRAVTNMVTFSKADQCVEFLPTANNNRVCMIMPGSLGQQFVPRVHDLSQVDSIVIFSGNKEQDEAWTKNWSKITAVLTEITPACDAFKQVARQCEQNATPVSVVATVKNLDQVDLSFMYTQILKETILSSTFEEKHVKEFTDYCRELFADSDEELTQVKAFESTYRSETPVCWYTTDGFLAPMLTRALRTMNGDIVIRMAFFIADLHRQLEQLHQEQYTGQPSSAVFTVYHAQSFAKAEFEVLKKNPRGMFSFNSFLVTSKNNQLSLNFAQETSTKGDQVGIMFIMKIDPTQSRTPFACIRDVSRSHTDEEVMLSIHSVFRITDIKRLTANNRLQEVYLTLVSDNERELTALTTLIRKESFPNEEGWYRLGAVFIKMRHLDKAEQVYRFLLTQTNDVDKSAVIFDQLGWIKDEQEKYPEAITFYEKSLAIYQKSTTINPADLANVYYYIGVAYYKTNNYPKALAAYKEGLKIREESLPPDHLDLAKAYSNIGLVYANMNDYPSALLYLEKDLAVNQKALPANHPDLAMSYMNVGMVSYNLDDYPKALAAYEKLLAIQQKILPANHLDLAQTFNYIGLVHNSLGAHPKALTFHEKALAIREKVLPRNHADLGTSYNNIGVTYENMGNHPKASSFLTRAVDVGEQSLPADHPVLQIRKENLQRVKDKL